jgi:hypothetical protein
MSPSRGRKEPLMALVFIYIAAVIFAVSIAVGALTDSLITILAGLIIAGIIVTIGLIVCGGLAVAFVTAAACHSGAGILALIDNA